MCVRAYGHFLALGFPCEDKSWVRLYIGICTQVLATYCRFFFWLVAFHGGQKLGMGVDWYLRMCVMYACVMRNLIASCIHL